MHNDGVEPSEEESTLFVSNEDLAWYFVLFPKAVILLRNLQKLYTLFNVTVIRRYLIYCMG